MYFSLPCIKPLPMPHIVQYQLQHPESWHHICPLRVRSVQPLQWQDHCRRTQSYPTHTRIFHVCNRHVITNYYMYKTLPLGLNEPQVLLSSIKVLNLRRDACKIINTVNKKLRCNVERLGARMTVVIIKIKYVMKIIKYYFQVYIPNCSYQPMLHKLGGLLSG